MRRTIYLSAFLLLSVTAGYLYYSHTRMVNAVVATRDLPVGTRISDGDVTIRSVNPVSLSSNILHSPDQAIGQVVSATIFGDQLIDARQLAPASDATLLASGVPLPTGSRVIGLPITPAAAVVGALKAGDLVDVIAIPNPAKAAALTDQPASPPIALGKDVLVLGLRTDQGTPVSQSDQGMTMGLNKPGTVLLAIPPGEENAYSAAIADSTFVLTLSTD